MLRRDGVIKPTSGWYTYLLKLAVAIMCMVVVIVWLQPDDSWWQSASAGYRIAGLLGLIAAAGVSYLVALLLMRVDIRKMIAHS